MLIIFYSLYKGGSNVFAKIKARVLVASVIVMVITLLTQGSLAYYSTVGTATNVVTSGGVSFITSLSLSAV